MSFDHALSALLSEANLSATTAIYSAAWLGRPLVAEFIARKHGISARTTRMTILKGKTHRQLFQAGYSASDFSRLDRINRARVRHGLDPVGEDFLSARMERLWKLPERAMRLVRVVVAYVGILPRHS